jgi:hypothetical protein
VVQKKKDEKELNLVEDASFSGFAPESKQSESDATAQAGGADIGDYWVSQCHSCSAWLQIAVK